MLLPSNPVEFLKLLNAVCTLGRAFHVYSGEFKESPPYVLQIIRRDSFFSVYAFCAST